MLPDCVSSFVGSTVRYVYGGVVPHHMDLICIYLFLSTLSLTLACLVTLYAPAISQLVVGFTTYGKTVKNEPSPLVKRLSVPKRYFTHFYIWAVVWTGWWLLYSVSVSHGVTSPTKWSTDMLAKLTRVGPHYSWTVATVGLVLVMFHVMRRCQESLFVSIFSDSTMNIAHYALGMIHYTILPLTVVCETIGLASTRKPSSLVLNMYELSWIQWLSIVAFLYFSWEQNKIVHRLAESRRGASGLATNYGHSVLYDGWFDLVSSPHFTFEILIYVSLWVFFGRSAATFKFLTLFVIVNQVFAGLITHKWYKAHFKTYPEKRRAIVPYLL